MPERTIRTSVDIPSDLHRQLHEAAARKGCSARQLILRGIQRAVEEANPQRVPKRLSLTTALVPAKGRKPFDFTNEQLHELIGFP